METEIERIEQEAERIARGMGIPPCPRMLVDFTAEMRLPEPDLVRVADLVGADVAVSALVLKTVNSPFYGITVKARSVRQALMFMGMSRVAFLLSGLLLRRAFAAHGGPAMEQFWSRSAKTAGACALLARRLGVADRDEAHTYGLFRDAGLALMLGRYPDHAELLAAWQADPIERITELERARYRVDHAVIGSVLAQDWGLPQAMSDAVLWHHAPSILAVSAEDRPVPAEAAALMAVGLCADRILHHEAGTPIPAEDDRHAPDAYALLGIDEARFVALRNDALATLNAESAPSARTLRLRPVGAA